VQLAWPTFVHIAQNVIVNREVYRAFPMGVRCAHGRIARAWERLEIPPHVYNKIPCHISKCRPCHLHLALWFSVLIARLTKSNRSTQRRALSIAVRNGFMHRGTASASSSLLFLPIRSGKAPADPRTRFIFANCSCAAEDSFNRLATKS
jgi:hypothetical protein